AVGLASVSGLKISTGACSCPFLLLLSLADEAAVLPAAASCARPGGPPPQTPPRTKQLPNLINPSRINDLHLSFCPQPAFAFQIPQSKQCKNFMRSARLRHTSK